MCSHDVTIIWNIIVCIGHWRCNCDLLNYMEYNCVYRPLEMKLLFAQVS